MAQKSEATLERLAEQNTRVDYFPRCSKLTGEKDEFGVELDCGKLLAERAPEGWVIKCVRCGHVNEG